MASARNIRSGSIDQLEMHLEDAEADATEDEVAAERAPSSTLVNSFERKRPAKAFSRALAARACRRRRASRPMPWIEEAFKVWREPALGLGPRDATETLEVVPRQRKVIQTRRFANGSPGDNASGHPATLWRYWIQTANQQTPTKRGQRVSSTTQRYLSFRAAGFVTDILSRRFVTPTIAPS
jgi:hypothetical protein